MAPRKIIGLLFIALIVTAAARPNQSANSDFWSALDRAQTAIAAGYLSDATKAITSAQTLLRAKPEIPNAKAAISILESQIKGARKNYAQAIALASDALANFTAPERALSLEIMARTQLVRFLISAGRKGEIEPHLRAIAKARLAQAQGQAVEPALIYLPTKLPRLRGAVENLGAVKASLSFDVDINGRASNIRLVKFSGANPYARGALIRLLKAAYFAPAMENERPKEAKGMRQQLVWRDNAVSCAPAGDPSSCLINATNNWVSANYR